mgnify:CR=1 FL=1
MKTLTENKLGGICLLVGPAVATLSFLVITFVLGDLSVPAGDFVAVGAAAAAASPIEQLIFLLVPVSLIMALFGASVIHHNIKESGTGAALFRLGLIMFAVNVGAIIVSGSLQHASVWDEGASYFLVVAGSGVWGIGGILGSIGILLAALALASRDDYNKGFAYIVAVVIFVSLVFNLIGWFGTGTWAIQQPISGISFIVASIWFITLGRSLLNKE